MFKNPSPADYKFEEATITEVDSLRKLVKVKTLSGQNMTNIPFMTGPGGASRNGERVTPVMGDRVVISSVLGYPIIIGFLPRLQTTTNAYPSVIDNGNQLVDTGSFSTGGDSISPDSYNPPDSIGGDNILTSVGGGIMALLRGGSILLRSSRLSEIFISKWDDLVRVVSRNWEHFTDLSSDTIKNLGGRVYRYTGYSQSFANSHIENYLFNQYWGDVAQGETAQANYIEPGSPTPDDRIYKEAVVTASGGSGVNLMTKEIHLTGETVLKVINAAQTLYSEIDNTNNSTNIVTGTLASGSGTTPFTRMYQTPSQLITSYNDTNIVTINASEINLSFGGNPTINMNSSGIQAIFGGAEINISSSGITASFDGAQVVINAAGVQNTFSGHYVNVTAAGPVLG